MLKDIKKENNISDNLLQLVSVASMASMAVGGGSLLKGLLFKGGRARSVFTGSMNNFLKGFYGKGVKGGGKLGLAVQEAGKGSLRMLDQGTSLSKSLALKTTGMSSTAREIAKEADAIQLLTVKRYLYGDIDKKTATGIIKNAKKKVHEKLTNDYRNNQMYGKDLYQNTGLQNYINRKGMKSESYVQMTNREGAKQIHSPATLRQLEMDQTNVIGRPVKYDNFAVYKNIPASDVFRGIQFDERAYNVMTNINQLGKKGVENAKNVMDAIKAAGLRPSFNVTNKGTDVYFALSPTIKPRYDWGGYKGLIKWSSNKPGHVKFSASDRPDLFGVQISPKNTLNISTSRTIKVPEAKKALDDLIKEKASPKYSDIARDELAEGMRFNSKVNQGVIKHKAKYEKRAEDVEELMKINPYSKQDNINLKKLTDEYDSIVKNPNNSPLYTDYISHFNKNRAEIFGGAGLLGTGYIANKMIDE